MSPRAKQQLYHSLAQLLRVGVTFPQALEKLGKTARGPVRQTVVRIRTGLERGQTVAEACVSADLGSTEAAVLTAVEHAGSLDRGLEQLAAHFGAVAHARGKILSKLAYPIFVLVLGVLLLNLPVIVKSGVPAYLNATVPFLAGLVVFIILVVLIGKFLAVMSAVDPFIDRLVRLIPVIGGMQSAFAMARFCMAYELQLGAGINVMNALEASAFASRSGLVRHAVSRVLPGVRGGNQAGPLLAEHRSFPPEVAEAIIVGEETGSLSSELRRLSETQSERAFRRLETLADWLPRLFYLGVLLYTGWMIIQVYREYLKGITSLLDGM
jgi:type IV pilus assembly protein PilC